MSLKMRYFTLEEAQGHLPKIKGLCASIQETKNLIEEKVAAWNEVREKVDDVEGALMQVQVEALAGRLEEQIAAVAEMGCLVKDIDKCLVDFPARIEGKEAYLCWMKGEEEIRFWHGITEGYQGRKPVIKESVQ